MARINLLTMHYDDNNGAFMQTYATSRILMELGHRVTIINLVKKGWFLGRFKQAYSYKLILRYLKFNHCRTRFYPRMTSMMFSPKMKKIPKADWTIVGSDQVWNPMVTSFSYLSYFLSFLANNDKRLSLSSSFGTKEWILGEEERAKVFDELHKFTAVSVRENEGVRICKETFGIDAVRLSDPTLVLSDYSCMNRPYKGEPYIGLFTFKPNGYSMDIANELSNHLGLMVKWVNSIVPYRDTSNIQGCRSWKQGPVEWYNHIGHSSFFISDSFHGVAFCLIQHIPFIALVADDRKISRITSLLKTYGLTDRLVQSTDEFHKHLSQYLSPIDWDKVDNVRLIERERYIQFINSNIG